MHVYNCQTTNPAASAPCPIPGVVTANVNHICESMYSIYVRNINLLYYILINVRLFYVV